jgi:hypothetical protein
VYENSTNPTKSLYSQFYYKNEVLVIAIYFTTILPTAHYQQEHSREVPWDEVVAIILTTKSRRKKGNVFEIETDKHYVLVTIRDKTLYVINAKKK